MYILFSLKNVTSSPFHVKHSYKFSLYFTIFFRTKERQEKKRLLKRVFSGIRWRVKEDEWVLSSQSYLSKTKERRSSSLWVVGVVTSLPRQSWGGKVFFKVLPLQRHIFFSWLCYFSLCVFFFLSILVNKGVTQLLGLIWCSIYGHAFRLSRIPPIRDKRKYIYHIFCAYHYGLVFLSEGSRERKKDCWTHLTQKIVDRFSDHFFHTFRPRQCQIFIFPREAKQGGNW